MFCLNSLCSKAKQLRLVLRRGIRPDFLEITFAFRKIRDLENDTTESNVLISSGPKLEMFMCPLRMNSGLLQICTVMKV